MTLLYWAVLIGVLLATVSAIHRAYPNGSKRVWILVGIFAWLGLLAIPVATGALQAAPVPRLMLFFLISNGAALAFALSPIGRRIAESTPMVWLVAFHAFRLPLEIVLHGWADQKLIPETMTWTGQNMDIVTGILAIVFAPVIARMRNVGLVWIFNVVGFALLLNVMRVAMMSSPLPFAWGAQPPLELAYTLPHAWIVPVCVGGALAAHVILFRALLQKRRVG